MGRGMKPVEITVTCTDEDEALRIMRHAVEHRLAACGQTWPIRSCYRWEEEVVLDREYVLLLKSVDSHFEALCEMIRSLHSYELPSIVMVPLDGTGTGYVEWLVGSTAPAVT